MEVKLLFLGVAALASSVVLATPGGARPDARHAWAVHDEHRPNPPQVLTPEGRPPSDAIVLFDGTAESVERNWCARDGGKSRWKVDAGSFVCVPRSGTVRTAEEFGDCQLHVEWRTTDDAEGGNSGVYLMGRYEIQIFNSHGVKTNEDPFKFGNYADGQEGAVYGQNPPEVNASRPVGEWQSYDIVFHPPRHEDGKEVEPATVTVLQNGVVVQDHWKLEGPTTWKDRASPRNDGVEKGPIVLQDHGTPVPFRNIWIRRLPARCERLSDGPTVRRKRLQLAEHVQALAKDEGDPLRKLILSYEVCTYRGDGDETALEAAKASEPGAADVLDRMSGGECFQRWRLLRELADWTKMATNEGLLATNSPVVSALARANRRCRAAAAASRNGETPFCALRFGPAFTDPDRWPGMRAALEKNAPAFDEVWFSTGVSFPKLSWHEEHARQCAAAADDLRKLGIVPSIEIQTILGHTDAIIEEEGDNSGHDWGTMVSCEGRAAKYLGCPRDPKLRAYFARVGELNAAWKPGSVWVDDDLSYRNRAPVSNPGDALAGCFCERCRTGFERTEGRNWPLQALVAAIRSDADVRQRWDAYQCVGYAELVRTIATAVHRVSPETRFGYQYGGQLQPAIPHGLFEGGEHTVRLRPGAGAYYDANPHDQIGKAYRLAAMLRDVRGADWIGACCPEIETCPRTFACRTPQGLILEAFENLALGMEALSLFAADARTDESTDFYSDVLFPRLASAYGFLRGYRDANADTVPCGLSVVDDQPPQLVACRGVPVVGAYGKSLGDLPPVVSIGARTAGSSGASEGPEYETRIMQIASSASLRDFAERADAASGNRLPVLFDRANFAFVLPRVREDLSLVTLAVVNASIDRQESVRLRLRGVSPDVTCVTWHEPESMPIRLQVEHAGEFACVRIPRMGAWACGYLSVP